MKFEVVNTQQEKEKPEQVIRLGLFVVDGGHGVVLSVVDESGKRADDGNILHVSSEGMSPFYYVSSRHGLPVDEAGRVVMSGTG